MAYNRSVFPERIDEFKKVSDIPPSMIAKAQEYKSLQIKQNKTPQEIERFNTISVELQDYIINPEFLNHLTDSMTGIQIFFRDETVEFIENLKIGMFEHIDNKEEEITSSIDGAIGRAQDVMTEAIGIMQGKKDHFITLVGTKEAEITAMVQEFDSRTARYYQRWAAKDGQVDFNIFNGDYSDLPNEAKLILDPKDIDVVIQGTILTPRIDYEILSNGLHDTIRLKGNASSLISLGTEVIARWHKNVGKLYFSHSATHELGGSDEIKNIQEPQLNQGLRNKINSGNTAVTNLKPASGMWYKVIG